MAASFSSARQPAVEYRQLQARSLELLCQHLLRGPELREDHHLVLVFPHDLQQAFDLGAGLQLLGLESQFRKQPARIFGQGGVLRQLLERPGSRLAGAAQSHLQGEQGHACRARATWLAKSAAHKVGCLLVEFLFPPAQGHTFCAGPAPSELQADRAAAIADHDFAQQAVQLVDVAGRQLVAPIHEVLLKLLGRAQESRLKQCDQIEELFQVVLHGRGRQQQDELLLQFAGKPPGLGRTIAQVMGFIHDDQVPFAPQDGRAVRLALGRVHRDDHAVELLPGILASFTKLRRVLAGKLQRELAAHFPLPLLDKRRGHQHQDGLRQAAQVQLGQHQAGLDRLAQAHFVAKQGPPAQPAQHGLGRAHLMFQQFHIAYLGQADQLIEPRMGRQACGPFSQLEFRHRCAVLPLPTRPGR